MAINIADQVSLLETNSLLVFFSLFFYDVPDIVESALVVSRQSVYLFGMLSNSPLV